MSGSSAHRMASDTPQRGPGNTAGYTSLEILVVLIVLAVAVAGYVALQRPPQILPLEMAASRLAGEIARAREEAVAREGEALIAARPDHHYAAQAGPESSLALAAIPAEEWQPLPDELAWGSGSATADPFGGAPAAIPAQVFCDSDGSCGTPAGSAAIYTIHSPREPARAAAVTLETDGSVQIWLWRDGTSTWSAAAR